jgi:hypothetical protein
MSVNRPAIAEFWNAFQKCVPALEAAASANDPTYEFLLAQLKQIHSGLFFEFCAKPGSCELIVTADGNRSLFPIVESIVASAPKVPGWSIIALKPKLGFPTKTTWNGFVVRIADVLFEPLTRQGSNDLGLRLFVPTLASESIDDAHNALLRALDHGLGERDFAESIQHTEVHPLRADAESDDYLPLSELENYLHWHKQRSNSR